MLNKRRRITFIHHIINNNVFVLVNKTSKHMCWKRNSRPKPDKRQVPRIGIRAEKKIETVLEPIQTWHKCMCIQRVAFHHDCSSIAGKDYKSTSDKHRFSQSFHDKITIITFKNLAKINKMKRKLANSISLKLISTFSNMCCEC